MKSDQAALFMVTPGADEALIASVERALTSDQADYQVLPTLSGLALRDPYFAQQLSELHKNWHLDPPPARTILDRIRTRIAWWLFGREIAAINATNARILRILDSLTAHLDDGQTRDR
jgi:hypothetical protein